MKSIALAVLVALVAGCAIVPIGPPPIYVGIHANGGYGYGHGGGGYYGGGRGYWGR